MSATPTLTKAALYHSHLVNCKECHTSIKGNPSVTSSWKIRDLLCPVGKKLFDEAVRENPKSPFKPTSFPFVARLYQVVLANSADGWVKGKVVDKSIGSDGTVLGYEVEYDVPSKRTNKVEKRHIYVNRFNIRRAGDGTPTKATYVIQTPKFKFKIGEKPKVESVEEKPKFRFRIGEPR